MTAGPLEAALRYAGRGWAVFPCHAPAEGGCSCRRPDCSSPAKHPRTVRGLHEATTDAETIARWWRRWPTSNVAVRTGRASGLIVLDVDADHGGLQSLAELQGRHGVLPASAAVRTGGGRHYWFAHPGGNVPNSAGRLGPGIDIRGDGGYVIAPPSIHASGRRYAWVSEIALAPVPSWVLSMGQHREPPPPRALTTPRDASAWAAAALRGELDRVRSATVGSRNHTLNRAAFALGQLVGGRCLDGDTVRDALVATGMGIGLSPHEVRATVSSGLRAGSLSPRAPSPASSPEPA